MNISEIDIRDIESIARGRNYPLPKSLKYLTISIMAIAAIGLMAFYSEKFYGLIIFMVCFAASIVDLILISRYRGKIYRDFLSEYNKTGKLPPWPKHHK